MNISLGVIFLISVCHSQPQSPELKIKLIGTALVEKIRQAMKYGDPNQILFKMDPVIAKHVDLGESARE